MAFVLKDRVQETTTTTGTGVIYLLGAVAGFDTFAQSIGTNTTYYSIVHENGLEWEVGLGSCSSAQSILSRIVVYESSNGDQKVDFTAGVKNVFCTLPAERAVTGETGVAPSAYRLYYTTTLNGSSFIGNGSTVVTNYWGTAREINGVSVNGSENVNLKGYTQVQPNQGNYKLVFSNQTGPSPSAGSYDQYVADGNDLTYDPSSNTINARTTYSNYTSLGIIYAGTARNFGSVAPTDGQVLAWKDSELKFIDASSGPPTPAAPDWFTIDWQDPSGPATGTIDLPSGWVSSAIPPPSGEAYRLSVYSQNTNSYSGWTQQYNPVTSNSYYGVINYSEWYQWNSINDPFNYWSPSGNAAVSWLMYPRAHNRVSMYVYSSSSPRMFGTFDNGLYLPGFQSPAPSQITSLYVVLFIIRNYDISNSLQATFPDTVKETFYANNNQIQFVFMELNDTEREQWRQNNFPSLLSWDNGNYAQIGYCCWEEW